MPGIVLNFRENIQQCIKQAFLASWSLYFKGERGNEQDKQETYVVWQVVVSAKGERIRRQ